ncbi:hypothetical protein CUJ91_11105 [Paraburkholderia graminis]|nr:hypothetical protein CUJ91_11105 [Paraburkholderia graminis]
MPLYAGPRRHRDQRRQSLIVTMSKPPRHAPPLRALSVRLAAQPRTRQDANRAYRRPRVWRHLERIVRSH